MTIVTSHRLLRTLARYCVQSFILGCPHDLRVKLISGKKIRKGIISIISRMIIFRLGLFESHMGHRCRIVYVRVRGGLFDSSERLSAPVPRRTWAGMSLDHVGTGQRFLPSPLGSFLPFAADSRAGLDSLGLVAVLVSICVVVFCLDLARSPPFVAYIWRCVGAWTLATTEVATLCTHLMHHRNSSLGILSRRWGMNGSAAQMRRAL